jgi:hypothetical protein
VSATRTVSTHKLRLFVQPAQQNAIANAEPGNHGLELLRKDRLGVEAVTVRVVEVADPEGVTVGGEKPQDAPEGSPVQLNETAEANELSGVTCTVAEALCPAITLSAAGETARVKLGVCGAEGLMV